jgi:hypothetical protein
LLIFIICLLLPFGVVLLPKYIRFIHSDYKITSGNDFFQTIFSIGNYGEFLTFNKLEMLNGYNKLMTNLYIPRKDGSTTEIDLIMISETGIYVFESKNYSGWIFGDEKQKYWTQTLKNKQKNKFYNPIWQNNGHISALKSVLGIHDTGLYKSYVIFSERCVLRKINMVSKNVKVIKRNSLSEYIKRDLIDSERILSTEQINNIYEKLREFCLVDKKLKQAHINEIKLGK